MASGVNDVRLDREVVPDEVTWIGRVRVDTSDLCCRKVDTLNLVSPEEAIDICLVS